MKKVVHQTSRVNWQMGQALLPEHFYAQEQSLREEASLRQRTRPVPSFGLASLALDAFQLVKGIVSVQEMTLFLPSGALVDVPGNTAPAVVNLNATGATTAPVYVHLASAFDVVTITPADASKEGVERRVQKIELSTTPYAEGGLESFKLAEMTCGPDGAWGLAPYIPPSVRVGGTPFFASYVARMQRALRALKQVLYAEVQENYLAAESQFSAKLCLRGAFEFEGFLRDLEGEIQPHPYELFRALRAVYIDACMFRGIQPAELERGYLHEDLASSFGGLLAKLEEQVDAGRQQVPYTEFERKEGMLACRLGAEVKKAKDVYLLVQKPHVSTALDMTRVKLGAMSRIQTVYERALRGIPMMRLEDPPFHHGLSATVEFYALTPGQEWDYAIREGNVVVFDGPQLAGSRLYLYWRNE